MLCEEIAQLSDFQAASHHINSRCQEAINLGAYRHTGESLEAGATSRNWAGLVFSSHPGSVQNWSHSSEDRMLSLEKSLQELQELK